MGKCGIVVIALSVITGCNGPHSKRISDMSQNKEMQRTDTSGYAPVNGIRMYYEIHGIGKPLVLIHGGGSTIQTSFGKIIPELSGTFQVIAVELQAHGHTSDRKAPESFEQDADDVATLLKHLDIPKASILGFSNGGTTAMQIALRHPEMVEKLILASAVYKREGMVPGFFEMMKMATLKDMPEVLKEAFLKINPDSSKLLTMFTKDRDRMIQFKDWSDETLRSIKAPALIINGDRDVVLPDHAVAMSKLIEGSRLVILPSGHGAYLGTLEAPDPGGDLVEMTLHLIKNFLDKP